MGTFEAGTQGAFRFEVRGIVDGRPLLVVEHITRIDDDCAPDWPQSTSPGGEHRVQLTGHPNLEVSASTATEPGEPGAAGGGNATAANRIVNAIPAVVRRAAGPGEPARPAADHRRRPARLLSQGVDRHHPGEPGLIAVGSPAADDHEGPPGHRVRGLSAPIR